MNAPSRRHLLAAGVGRLAAGAAVADAAMGAMRGIPAPHGGDSGGAVGAATAGDPVAALCEQILALHRMQTQTIAAATAVRRRLSRQSGNPVYGVASAKQLWGHDPACAELTRLNREADRLVDEMCDLFDELVAMPASTPAAALAKLRLALSEWMWPDHLELEWHHEATLDLVRDAARVLAGAA